jgi:hypothetical protein
VQSLEFKPQYHRRRRKRRRKGAGIKQSSKVDSISTGE